MQRSLLSGAAQSGWERVGLCSLFFCLFCSSESPAWRWRYAAASDAAGYSASADGPVSMALPVIGGTVGLFAAKLLLPAADQTLLPFLISAILLLFSLGLGIGSLNFVKWMFVRKNRAMF